MKTKTREIIYLRLYLRIAMLHWSPVPISVRSTTKDSPEVGSGVVAYESLGLGGRFLLVQSDQENNSDTSLFWNQNETNNYLLIAISIYHKTTFLEFIKVIFINRSFETKKIFTIF